MDNLLIFLSPNKIDKVVDLLSDDKGAKPEDDGGDVTLNENSNAATAIGYLAPIFQSSNMDNTDDGNSSDYTGAKSKGNGDDVMLNENAEFIIGENDATPDWTPIE